MDGVDKASHKLGIHKPRPGRGEGMCPIPRSEANNFLKVTGGALEHTSHAVQLLSVIRPGRGRGNCPLNMALHII
jgi:hypothetical protein